MVTHVVHMTDYALSHCQINTTRQCPNIIMAFVLFWLIPVFIRTTKARKHEINFFKARRASAWKEVQVMVQCNPAAKIAQRHIPGMYSAQWLKCDNQLAWRLAWFAPPVVSGTVSWNIEVYDKGKGLFDALRLHLVPQQSPSVYRVWIAGHST